jgi:hypothetical protein
LAEDNDYVVFRHSHSQRRHEEATHGDSDSEASLQRYGSSGFEGTISTPGSASEHDQTRVGVDTLCEMLGMGAWAPVTIDDVGIFEFVEEDPDSIDRRRIVEGREDRNAYEVNAGFGEELPPLVEISRQSDPVDGDDNSSM